MSGLCRSEKQIACECRCNRNMGKKRISRKRYKKLYEHYSKTNNSIVSEMKVLRANYIQLDKLNDLKHALHLGHHPNLTSKEFAAILDSIMGED